MKLALLPGIELHSVNCVCGGSGWIGFLGIGSRPIECAARHNIKLTLTEWDEAGKPKTIEEYETKCTNS